MNSEKDYEFEVIEKYYGGEDQVKTIIENCPLCGAKFVMTHSPDSGNLLVHETKRCLDCDFGHEVTIHVLN